jgi:hypothetical protein
MKAFKMLAAVTMVGFLFAVAVGAESMEPKEKTVKGKVEVMKDASGTVTGVEIKTWDMKYHVTLDAKGMELAAMEGKHVEATGTVEKKDHEHWLTVMSFQEKEKEKENK